MATIDLQDPGVRRLLGDADRGRAVASTSGGKKLIRIAGDEDHGFSSSIQLDTGKQEVLVYYPPLEMWLTVDVYALPGEAPHAILFCPRCHHALTIKGTEKDIEFEPHEPLRIAARVPPELAHLGKGVLSVDPFQCTWELDTKQAATHDIGARNLCRLKLAIDRNVARDA